MYKENQFIYVDHPAGGQRPLLCKITINNIDMLFKVLIPGTVMSITSNCRRHDPSFGLLTKAEQYRINCEERKVLAPDILNTFNDRKSYEEFCRVYFIYGEEVDEKYKNIDKP